jgi:2-phospho-L-lactate guanylyltransferase
MTLFAVVPVKDLAGAKSRLKPNLNAPGRAGLTIYMMNKVLTALQEAGVEHACVVSTDRTVLCLAEKAGATQLLQESQGLNPALDEARDWASSEGASALLIFPADLPLLQASDVEAVLKVAQEIEGPLAVVSPDAIHEGTNALLLRPPDALPFSFGQDSFDAHVKAARERGLSSRICERSRIAFDLDTGDDLQRFASSRKPS